MNILGLDINYFESDGYDNNPADLGNYIAEKYIEYGLLDGSNEQVDYVNQFYEPINEPLAPIFLEIHQFQIQTDGSHYH